MIDARQLERNSSYVRSMDRGFLRHFPIARNHYRDFISILCGRKGGSDKTGETKVLKQRNAKRRSTAFFFRRPTLIRAVFGAGSNSISNNSRATIWKFHCLSPTCKVGYVFLLPPKVTSFLCDISPNSNSNSQIKNNSCILVLFTRFHYRIKNDHRQSQLGSI